MRHQLAAVSGMALGTGWAQVPPLITFQKTVAADDPLVLMAFSRDLNVTCRAPLEGPPVRPAKASPVPAPAPHQRPASRYARWLHRRLCRIPLEETTFARRGFRGGEAGARQRLELIGRTFLQGYNAALEEDEPEALTLRLNTVEAKLQGFAFEGAAMGLALLDSLTPWKRDRWLAFMTGRGAAHLYMVHIGVGWVVARLPWLRWDVERSLRHLDPLLRWLAFDGYGFHQGYFHWPEFVGRQAIPERLTGYACRAFDQGLGRSLWFVDGADVSRIPSTIAVFAPSRRADLWSGVGLACAYAGEVDSAALKSLRAAAGSYQPELAQGAAFAAKARTLAGNPAPHTDMACQVLCGLTAEEAARITDLALHGLSAHGPEPAYEYLRRRIQYQLVVLNEVRE